MIINTTRFGQVQIQAEDLVTFPEGLLGFFDLKRYVFLEDPHDEIFAWLQSVEEPAIAFPVLEPELFTAHYAPQLLRTDLEGLGFRSGDVLRTFCIVTIPEDPTQMTANLKAPVIINLRNRQARQCVLQDNQLAIREPIFEILQKKVVAGGWPQRGNANKSATSMDQQMAPYKDIIVTLPGDEAIP